MFPAALRLRGASPEMFPAALRLRGAAVHTGALRPGGDRSARRASRHRGRVIEALPRRSRGWLRSTGKGASDGGERARAPGRVVSAPRRGARMRWWRQRRTPCLTLAAQGFTPKMPASGTAARGTRPRAEAAELQSALLMRVRSARDWARRCLLHLALTHAHGAAHFLAQRALALSTCRVVLTGVPMRSAISAMVSPSKS
jgi:hypothetical protein